MACFDIHCFYRESQSEIMPHFETRVSLRLPLKYIPSQVVGIAPRRSSSVSRTERSRGIGLSVFQ